VSFDVAVVGAGIVGAATASELARRGVKVALLDRGEVSSGTTGLGEGNVLASDKDAGPELDLTLLGLAMYDELEDRFGALARIRRKGALIVHPSAGTWEEEPARVERLRACGVEATLLTEAEARDREPALTGDLHGASFFGGDLQCAPREIARALAAEPGVTVYTGREVSRVRVERGKVTEVETPDGALACGAVVLAAGVWTAPLAAGAGLTLPLEPRKGQLVLLRAPAGASDRFIRHKVVDGSYLRSVASASPGLQVTTVLETTWGGDVLVGSSRERRGFDISVDEAVSESMVDRGARLMPALGGLERVGAWAGLRPWLPDGLPAIGRSAAADGLWVATGHEGAGVALGPITGRVIAAAVCGEALPMSLRAFDPDRFADGAPKAAG
jgi:glycine/D-amino acid oxidase-like deaminating enzyme